MSVCSLISPCYPCWLHGQWCTHTGDIVCLVDSKHASRPSIDADGGQNEVMRHLQHTQLESCNNRVSHHGRCDEDQAGCGCLRFGVGGANHSSLVIYIQMMINHLDRDFRSMTSCQVNCADKEADNLVGLPTS